MTDKVLPRRPALHGAPEFVSWTWEMINGGYRDIGWSTDGTELVVSNPERLTREVFPEFFRHSQYSSFVRALNAYQFKKTKPGRWTHPNFQRGKPELLKNITRKPASKPSPPPKEARAGKEDALQQERSAWDLLAEERERMEFLRVEMAKLESQLQQAQQVEWQQRAEAVQIGQFVASEVRAFAPAGLHPEMLALAGPILADVEGTLADGKALVGTYPQGYGGMDCAAIENMLAFKPTPGMCKRTDEIRDNCKGCHCTATEVRQLCLEYLHRCKTHERLAAEAPVAMDLDADGKLVLAGPDGATATPIAVAAAAVPLTDTQQAMYDDITANLSRFPSDLTLGDLNELVGGLDVDALTAEDATTA